MKLFFVLFATFSLCHAINRYDFGPTFWGEGTYYGTTERGNCAIRPPMPEMYSGMVPVALNNEQYGTSDACGACLLVTGTGKGSGADPIVGTFKAYVMDRCPECKKGDIDLSKGGDGRWEVSWKFIPCPGQKQFFLFEGSNSFYWKLQPRGGKYPIQKIVIAGITGTRTQDNFYFFQNSAGFKTPATIAMTDTMGTVVTVTVTYFKEAGPVYPSGSSQQKPSAPARRPTPQAPRSAPPQPITKPKCVPKFKPCTGPKNYWKTSNCCLPNFRCVKASAPNFRYKRCEPIVRGKAKCVPSWKACTGPDNKWGTSRCCGNFVCRRPWRKSFRGLRCIPRRRR